MWVIKKETTYPKTETRDEISVTSYFHHLGFFVEWTGQIERAKRFKYKSNARDFMELYNLERPNSVLTLVNVGNTKQEKGEP